jgi:hypothetical protein
VTTRLDTGNCCVCPEEPVTAADSVPQSNLFPPDEASQMLKATGVCAAALRITGSWLLFDAEHWGEAAAAIGHEARNGDCVPSKVDCVVGVAVAKLSQSGAVGRVGVAPPRAQSNIAFARKGSSGIKVPVPEYPKQVQNFLAASPYPQH